MSVPVSCDEIDPTNATNISNAQAAVVDGRTLELRKGNIGGVQYAWVRLSNAHEGDSIWLEVSGDGGDTWKECGRRTVPAGGPHYTKAQRTSSSPEVRMRAVTQLVGRKYQTAPW
jgi:hypothetical protein